MFYGDATAPNWDKYVCDNCFGAEEGDTHVAVCGAASDCSENHHCPMPRRSRPERHIVYGDAFTTAPIVICDEPYLEKHKCVEEVGV
jgi:hypothetical protein